MTALTNRRPDRAEQFLFLGAQARRQLP